MTAGALVSRPPLARSHEDRALAGVLGGIAAWLRAPSWVLRLAFAFAVFAQPWLLAGYVLAAVALPAQGRRGFDWGAVLGLGRLAAILVGLPFLVIWAGAFDTPGPDVWVPLGGLGFIGLFALGMHRGPTRSSDDRTVVLAAAGLLLALALLALGVVAAPGVRWDRVAAVPLLAAGAALAVRPEDPRIRALLVPAGCLAALALLLAAADVQLEGGVGEASRRPATVAAAAVPIRRAVGNVRLDLRRLARSRGRATLRLTAGVGDVKVQLPPGVRVDLDLRTGRGTILTLDDSRDERWENVVRRTTWTASNAAAPPHPPRPPLSLHVVARVGEGDIDISGHPADPEAQP